MSLSHLLLLPQATPARQDAELQVAMGIFWLGIWAEPHKGLSLHPQPCLTRREAGAGVALQGGGVRTQSLGELALPQGSLQPFPACLGCANSQQGLAPCLGLPHHPWARRSCSNVSPAGPAAAQGHWLVHSLSWKH